MWGWKGEELELQQKNRQNTMISNFSNSKLVITWLGPYLKFTLKRKTFSVVNTVNEITREKFLNGEEHFQDTITDFRNIHYLC